MRGVLQMKIDADKLLKYVSDQVSEKHKTCLTDMFDNGWFWAMKELQSMLLIGEFHE
jgi:hypothetical protein